MKCVHTVLDTLYLLVTLFGIVKGECYRAELSEDVWSCADFDNKFSNCEPLELGMVEGKDGKLGLNCKISVFKDIEMNVEIWKIMDVGKEYMYHTQGDIFSSLKDDKALWYPMIDAMKIKYCPIAMKTISYIITDNIISLEYAKDMMTHELCGEYIVQLSMSRSSGLEKLSCYQMTITVSDI